VLKTGASTSITFTNSPAGYLTGLGKLRQVGNYRAVISNRNELSRHVVIV
jgi:hypothetical protein